MALYLVDRCSVRITKIPSLPSPHWPGWHSTGTYALLSRSLQLHQPWPPWTWSHKRGLSKHLKKIPQTQSPSQSPGPLLFPLIRLLFPSQYQYLPHPYSILSTRLIPFQQRPRRNYFPWATEIRRSHKRPSPLPTHTHQWRRAQILEHKGLIGKGVLPLYHDEELCSYHDEPTVRKIRPRLFIF